MEAKKFKAKFNLSDKNNYSDELINKVTNAVSTFETNFFNIKGDGYSLCGEKTTPYTQRKWLEKDGVKVGPTVEYIFDDNNNNNNNNNNKRICCSINIIE